MDSKPRACRTYPAGLIAGVISIVAALAVTLLGLGRGLVELSYDLLQPFHPGGELGNLVIVTLDPPTDRRLHAEVIERLSQEGAALVVADLFLDEARDLQEDERLARAMRANGRVLLAGDYIPLGSGPDVVGGTEAPPLDLFRTNALGWGLAKLLPAQQFGQDGVIRRHYFGTASRPSLPWLAAHVAGAAISPAPSESELQEDWWIRFYGPAGSIRVMPAEDATNQPAGVFRGAFVFIGSEHRTPYQRDGEDEFQIPFTRFDGRLASGAEVLATSFLNLLRDDAVVRSSVYSEVLAIFVVGVLFGCGLGRLRLVPAILAALAGSAMTAAAALLLCWFGDIWFPWLVIGAVQIPCALVIRLLGASQHSTPSPVSSSSDAATSPESSIPDHVLQRRIGAGGYGEVWLATNAVGIHHAVKIVHRSRFESDAPYERELEGIKSFMPLSSAHPGLVNILHVGRKDSEGYFYYIMEAADDEQRGPDVLPASYRPKTLAQEIQRRGALPAHECLSVILCLADALAFLHRHQLVHRDIKPANVIYVRAHPKLADIGLVALAASSRGGKTVVGTEGYLLTEAPGTMQADVYALGKLLYVMLSGLSASQFPELSSDFRGRADFALSSELNEIAWKACGINPSVRYASAAEVHAELLHLQPRP